MFGKLDSVSPSDKMAEENRPQVRGYLKHAAQKTGFVYPCHRFLLRMKAGSSFRNIVIFITL
jgi:hypothetical protein